MDSPTIHQGPERSTTLHLTREERQSEVAAAISPDSQSSLGSPSPNDNPILNFQAKPFIPRSNESPSTFQLRSKSSLNTIKENVPLNEQTVPISSLQPILKRIADLEATALTLRHVFDDLSTLKSDLFDIINRTSLKPTSSPQQFTREQSTSSSPSPVQSVLSIQPQRPSPVQHRHSLPVTSSRLSQPSPSPVQELSSQFNRRKSDSPDLFLHNHLSDPINSLQNLANLQQQQQLQIARFSFQNPLRDLRDDRRSSHLPPFGAIGSSPLVHTASWDSVRRQSTLNSFDQRPSTSGDSIISSRLPHSSNQTDFNFGPSSPPTSTTVQFNASTAVLPPTGSLFSKWEALGLDPNVVKALVRYGIGPPSKIQQKSIPALLKSNDIVAQAAAISERIQSYVIPVVHMILHSSPANLQRGNIQILMVTCTIDEASQCHRLAIGLGSTLGIRASISIGNNDLSQELQTIQTSLPHILIGTPARLLDILATRVLNMNDLRLIILDECDQLVARNLTDLVTGLIKHIPHNPDRQTAIYSCTIPQEVLTFASSNLNLREPVRVLVRREQSEGSNPSMRGLKQFYLYIAVGSNATTKLGNANLSAREWKLEALIDLCEDYDFTQAVIYCASVDTTEAVTYKLTSRGIDALALHQDMGGPARHSVLSKFRSSTSSIPGMKSTKKCLVVYDALCRSLNDVHQVPLVINFDLPRAPEDYVHRVSCATSAGHVRPGIAINFLVDSRDIDMLRQIESLHRTRISELPPSYTSLVS